MHGNERGECERRAGTFPIPLLIRLPEQAAQIFGLDVFGLVIDQLISDSYQRICCHIINQ